MDQPKLVPGFGTLCPLITPMLTHLTCPSGSYSLRTYYSCIMGLPCAHLPSFNIGLVSLNFRQSKYDSFTFPLYELSKILLQGVQLFERDLMCHKHFKEAYLHFLKWGGGAQQHSGVMLQTLAKYHWARVLSKHSMPPRNALLARWWGVFLG